MLEIAGTDFQRRVYQLIRTGDAFGHVSTRGARALETERRSGSGLFAESIPRCIIDYLE